MIALYHNPLLLQFPAVMLTSTWEYISIFHPNTEAYSTLIIIIFQFPAAILLVHLNHLHDN